jgi:urea transport system permease protein
MSNATRRAGAAWRDGVRGRRGTGIAVLVVAALLPFVLSDFLLKQMALFLPLVILAIGVDLLWGENRLVSFGHGAFFALGGYVGGLILSGAPGNVVGAQSSFLTGADSKPLLDRALEALNAVQLGGVPLLALLVAPLVTGLIGLVIGAVMFRVASPEIYVPLLTLGISVLASLALNDVAALGGSNGLGGIPSYTDTLTATGATGVSTYLFNACVLAAVMVGYWLFRRSDAGVVWRALGDDPVRTEALGYSIRRLRALGFGASTALAGAAGALYAGTSNYIGPSLAGVLFSTQILIWLAVGGTGTLMGPLVGVMVVKWGEHYLSSDLGFEESWQLFLGVMLIVVVLVAPSGLAGLPRQVRLARSRGRGGGRGGGDGASRTLEPAPSVTDPAV